MQPKRGYRMMLNWMIAGFWTAAAMTMLGVLAAMAKQEKKQLTVVGEQENVIYVKAVVHRNSA